VLAEVGEGPAEGGEPVNRVLPLYHFPQFPADQLASGTNVSIFNFFPKKNLPLQLKMKQFMQKKMVSKLEFKKIAKFL
jgi:hypothetical protein